MPSVNPSPFGPKPQFELANGLPAVGNLLYSYIAGTNTKQNTYSNSTGTVANANPISLNSLGQPATELWLEAGVAYKFVFAPAGDTDPPTSPIWTVDNLRGINDIGSLSAWTITGALNLTGDISPTQISLDQNDYNPTGLSAASTVRVSTVASHSITGIAGGTDGRILTFHNVGSFPLNFPNESASSGTANRLALPASSLALAPNDSVTFRYDSVSSRWRLISSSTAGAAVAPASPTVHTATNPAFALSYNLPAAAIGILACCKGAGASGGGSNSGTANGGGGGEGEETWAYFSRAQVLAAGVPLSMQAGLGGAAIPANTNSNGNAGATSSLAGTLSTLLTAAGGSPGLSAGNGAAGGAGGTGGTGAQWAWPGAVGHTGSVVGGAAALIAPGGGKGAGSVTAPNGLLGSGGGGLGGTSAAPSGDGGSGRVIVITLFG